MSASPARAASSAAPAALYPRFARSRRGRVIGGVGAGLARHLGVDVRWVRVFFAAASFAGGFGFILYALLWAFTPLRDAGEDATPDPASPGWPAPVYFLLAALGAVGAATSLSLVSGAGGAFVFLVGIVAVGAVVVWQAYDRGLSSASNFVALALGILLVMGGVTAVALLGDSTGTAGIVMAVLASVFGVALLVIPLVVRLTSSLMEERKAKAVADQRAEIASRLHDSVLQTLALIQKRSTDPSEVARLARAQERELRAWLFDADPATPEETLTFFGALARAAGEVEDVHGVTIRPVTVGGDVAFTRATEPVVLAAREAMVNAATHAGVDRVDVYAEHLGGELAVYVRDRGVGFDPGAVPADRHGVRDSILGRMERAGGTATITPVPGEGTEVELRTPHSG
ncbi:ATP-binding protein [uncultured Corynebacterium sp.]|uniref:ATP-binding protein n=1 Tax=uncultured Corynebacterium sp. TaxID=159447 RepID=UPI002598B443|nr:ATP-binding protein [uncultured Corynebacterium sp.]